MPIPLSPRSKQIASILFPEATRNRILERLHLEASENIPFCEDHTPEQMDRIRFSIMKLVAQNPANEDYAFKLAKVDWRDLFMAADFGYSATEHEQWYSDVTKM